jgi:creatinine amidohydrolase/Fe(II)-dependent formamide hydrolase-like protein
LEELTASDFREGVHRAQGTCLLPFGILEKHGPHLDAVVKTIRAVKADDGSLKVQNEFYEKSKHPLETQP